MTQAHNGMIRGLDSIHHHSVLLSSPPTVRADFLSYCQCWCESMHHHYEAEGEGFFSSVEWLSGVQGLMERNVEQHQAFTPGLRRLRLV
ncbi:cysteine-tRNA ligase [Sphaceloma murrayae]|uniref:Cysteine-tRNA ligase n=1 Tax=Sphaceloma murrayae TaxID=2082308 RepID=A0A2K1QXZ1_9PEZI|nr:cysteine-tRNA ligase [Sphaceloma murrayae]